MTREDEALSRERKLVVVFDICSSTTILEDLKRTDNLAEWRNLLIGLKNCLLHEGEKFGIELHKFIGDGWILFFPDAIPKSDLCTFLRVLSMSFDAQFESTIKPLLSQEPSPIGLMFGIDAGELIRLELNKNVEYLGRPINVASRLQSHTKELAGGPSYKALFSKNSFNLPPPPPANIEVEQITVPLRNISPPTIDCLVYETYQDPRRREEGKSAETLHKAPQAVPAVSPSRSSVDTASNFKVTGFRQFRIAQLGYTGPLTQNNSGQRALLVEFTNEARQVPLINSAATVRAVLIYSAHGKELFRIKGSWLDGFDQPTFRVDDSHYLIIGLACQGEFGALGVQRKTTALGSDQIEVSRRRFTPVPPKISLVVRLTDADSGSFLYAGEFEISTDSWEIEAVSK